MNKNIKLAITLSFLFFATLALVFKYFSQRQNAGITNKNISPPQQKTIIENATLQEFTPIGKHGWNIKAQKMIIDQAGNEAECHDVSCSIHLGEHDKVDIEARNLHLDKATRNLSITKHFEARYQHAQIASTQLIYNFEKKVIEIPEPSTIKHSVMQTEAGRILGDTNTKTISIENGVTTRLFLASTSSNKSGN